jgi:hypothetical protein
VTEENAAAADCRSPAGPSHPSAAASIGVEPAPTNINAESTSGGGTEKFTNANPSQRDMLTEHGPRS